MDGELPTLASVVDAKEKAVVNGGDANVALLKMCMVNMLAKSVVP